MKLKHYLLLAADPEATGGSDAIDRGDNIPEDINPEDPDAETAAAEAAKKLEAEIEAEKDGDDEDEEKPKSKKDSRIPLARHKEILEQQREINAELVRKLKQFEGGQQVADANAELTKVENHVMKLEKDYATMLTDGELDKATAIMREIRGYERQMIEYKSDMKIAASEAKATEKARFNVALERIEASFPVLNPDHDDYNAELEQEVVDLKAAYETRGMTPTQAMQKAVKVLIGAETTRQEIATTSQPKVSEKAVANERKVDAVKKTSEAVAKTPPNLSRVGLDGDKLGGGKLDAQAVMSMSQKEFAKLNEADLAQMRGDVI